MIVIGDMLGVAPEDRDDLLRWSDDMLKSLGSDDEALIIAAGQRRGRVPRLHPGPGGRAPGLGRRLGPHRHAGARRGRRRAPRRRVARVRVAADPRRRGRDDPPRHQRRHGGAAAPAARSGTALLARPDAAAGGRRGDAAVGVAHQEHVPDGHRGHRAAGPGHPPGPEADAAVPVGQPGRGRLRGAPRRSTSGAAPTSTSRSASARTSASATVWHASR